VFCCEVAAKLMLGVAAKLQESAMLGALASLACFVGLLYYRSKYREAVIHHRAAAKLWQKMMMNIMSEQIGRYFRDTCITNHVVRYRNDKIEISVGNEDVLVAVDMELFKIDIDKAFEDAYNRFVIHVR